MSKVEWCCAQTAGYLVAALLVAIVAVSDSACAWEPQPNAIARSEGRDANDNARTEGRRINPGSGRQDGNVDPEPGTLADERRTEALADEDGRTRSVVNESNVQSTVAEPSRLTIDYWRWLLIPVLAVFALVGIRAIATKVVLKAKNWIAEHSDDLGGSESRGSVTGNTSESLTGNQQYSTPTVIPDAPLSDVQRSVDRIAKEVEKLSRRLDEHEAAGSAAHSGARALEQTAGGEPGAAPLLAGTDLDEHIWTLDAMESLESALPITAEPEVEGEKWPLSFPRLASECISIIHQKAATFVVAKKATIPGTLERAVEGPDAAFMLVPLGETGERWLALPNRERFAEAQEYHRNYNTCYECDNPSSGTLTVHEAAVVCKIEDEWALELKGILLVEP